MLLEFLYFENHKLKKEPKELATIVTTPKTFLKASSVDHVRNMQITLKAAVC